MKLVVAEPETAALQRWLRVVPRHAVACDLARTELLRAVRRIAPDLTERARRVLDTITLMDLPTSLFEQAGRLDPAELRTLDALHLSSALDLGDDLDCMVTYDSRLADAARLTGIRVEQPMDDRT